MASVCLYFQVHQPRRLRRYGFFEIGSRHDYEDEAENRRILDRIAEKCYRPACERLLALVDRYGGDFRIAFSLSGVLIDQLEAHRPEILELFQRLSATGCVEFLNETDSHSLAFLFSRREFREQVLRHRKRIGALFGQEGRTFRHTELIYSNAVAAAAERMGYRTILAEGAERILGRRSPNLVYRAAGCRRMRVLPRNWRLSDDVAFRFSEPGPDGRPLTAARYAHWLHAIDAADAVVNLFMDFETFGEHHWREAGIFEFLEQFPGELLRHRDFRFRTPAEAAAAATPAGEIDSPGFVSWADEERDLTAWLGNAMQKDAADKLYRLEGAVRRRGDDELLGLWRRLQTSDHLYYMCTKWFADGDVHRYFNPYESPYEAYINFMNVIDDLSRRVGEKKERKDGRKSGVPSL